MREEGPEAPVDWAGCSELGLRNATSERHARFQVGRCVFLDRLGEWMAFRNMRAHLANPHDTNPTNPAPQTMISSMMSSQTTDIVNEGAMRRLQEACGITIEGLEALGEERIAAIIKPVSFYTPKAQNILKVRRDWVAG